MTKINSSDYLSPQIIEHVTKTTTYAKRNPGPDLKIVAGLNQLMLNLELCACLKII